MKLAPLPTAKIGHPHPHVWKLYVARSFLMHFAVALTLIIAGESKSLAVCHNCLQRAYIQDHMDSDAASLSLKSERATALSDAINTEQDEEFKQTLQSTLDSVNAEIVALQNDLSALGNELASLGPCECDGDDDNYVDEIEWEEPEVPNFGEGPFYPWDDNPYVNPSDDPGPVLT